MITDFTHIDSLTNPDKTRMAVTTWLLGLFHRYVVKAEPFEVSSFGDATYYTDTFTKDSLGYLQIPHGAELPIHLIRCELSTELRNNPGLGRDHLIEVYTRLAKEVFDELTPGMSAAFGPSKIEDIRATKFEFQDIKTYVEFFTICSKNNPQVPTSVELYEMLKLR